MTKKQRLVIFNITLAAISLGFFVGQWTRKPTVVNNGKDIILHYDCDSNGLYRSYGYTATSNMDWSKAENSIGGGYTLSDPKVEMDSATGYLSWHIEVVDNGPRPGPDRLSRPFITRISPDVFHVIYWHWGDNYWPVVDSTFTRRIDSVQTYIDGYLYSSQSTLNW
jgi:hypothetical protein